MQRHIEWYIVFSNIKKRHNRSIRITCQIYNLSYKIIITLHKANQNKLWTSIPNQPNVEG